MSRLPPRRSIHTRKTLAAMAMPVNSQRCQPSCAGQEAERGAGVVGEHQAEEARDRQLLAFAEQRDDPRLGREVERDHGDGQQQPPPPRVACAGPAVAGHRVDRCRCDGIALMQSLTCATRSGAVRRCRTGWPRSARTASGCARSAPTSARQCQQRSHLACALGVTCDRERIARHTVAADVIVTKRRSSPSEASAA